MPNSNSVITPQNTPRAAITTASNHQEVIKPTTITINKKVSGEISERKPHEDDKNNDDDDANSQQKQKREVETLQSQKEAIADEALQGQTEISVHKPNEDDKNNDNDDDDDDKSQEEKNRTVEVL
ncbi:hypothetical protein RJ641_010636 [Dillenia turbinata]|uniref:Uncharacterized protein n=1 Tax=Dillenia turbinata TaxID=194707 RepID=A0AAN8Z4H1_9MAGN